MTRYFIRVQAPSEPADAYATRGPDGLPVWTWQQPEPLTLEEAEALMRDTARTCGGSLLLELQDAPD
jgi:hypothetical protein